METVIIVIHLMVVIALVGVVLVQKSEGGALGIGGGGGNFMSSRGTANVLTRATTILAVAFFVTSISLTLLARQGAPTSIFDQGGTAQPATQGEQAPADQGGQQGGILNQLNQLNQSKPSEPQVPQSQ